jgi:hypothetical protein
MLRTLLFSIFLTGLAFADRSKDYQEWHEKSRSSKDTGTIDYYIGEYQKRINADPKDQLAKVYLGSAYTLRSAESFWGPKKLEYLKKGGKLMDDAVAAAPKDPRVRFIRATNAYQVPKRFKRRDIAVMDFTMLLPIAEKGGHGLTIRERQAMLFYAWKTFQEEGQATLAERAKKACHQLDPKSWYGEQVAGS